MSSSRQQPAFEEEVVRLRNLALAVAQEPKVWMNDAELLSATGVRLGQGTLADAIHQGGDRLTYIRKVLDARAAAISELKAAKRKKGKTAGPPALKTATGTRGAP